MSETTMEVRGANGEYVPAESEAGIAVIRETLVKPILSGYGFDVGDEPAAAERALRLWDAGTRSGFDGALDQCEAINLLAKAPEARAVGGPIAFLARERQVSRGHASKRRTVARLLLAPLGRVELERLKYRDFHVLYHAARLVKAGAEADAAFYRVKDLNRDEAAAVVRGDTGDSRPTLVPLIKVEPGVRDAFLAGLERAGESLKLSDSQLLERLGEFLLACPDVALAHIVRAVEGGIASTITVRLMGGEES